MQTDALNGLLNYIEANLTQELSRAMLALHAGYWAYHFSRMFSCAIGVPVAAYVLQRRLKRALREIARKRKCIDVVMEYGFSAYAGFYKAFLREYGCSPTKYIALYGNRVFRQKRGGLPCGRPSGN